MQESKTYRPHDLLTLEEAAEEFRVSRRWLRTLRAERRVRSYVVSNKTRFRWSDLYDYLESCANVPPSVRR